MIQVSLHLHPTSLSNDFNGPNDDVETEMSA